MARATDTTRLASLRAARDLMDSKFAATLDTSALAAQAGYSRYHFIRAFRTAYGATPGEYLSRRRVERACELLRSANLTVTEVCFLVGFSSLGSFSTRFSELTGCSPSRYQRRHRMQGAPPPIPGCVVLMWGAPQPAEPNPAAEPSPAAESNRGEARPAAPPLASARAKAVTEGEAS